MISVLCTSSESLYTQLPNLDLWPISRNAYNFNHDYPVITHAPCPQWSRLKAFSLADDHQKNLARFCLQKVFSNGGIFEHPAGSSFFKEVGIKPTLSIDQSWFGFPVRKRTYLFFYKCKPLSFPLNFDIPPRSFSNLSHRQRSEMTLSLCSWLCECVYASFPHQRPILTG